MWSASAASTTETGFQVLLDGKSTYEGKYQVWDTDASGLITESSGWKTANQAKELNWDTLFNLELSDDTVAIKDANNDGLVDSAATYQIFNNGEAITLTDSNGTTYSNSSPFGTQLLQQNPHLDTKSSCGASTYESVLRLGH